MATSSILGGERAATQAAGRDTGALGPSDSSDSGSDIQGSLGLESPGQEDLFADTAGPANTSLHSDPDAGGTGERGAAVPGEDAREASDISPDRITSLNDPLDDALDDPDRVSLDADEDPESALENLAGEESTDEERDAEAAADANP